MEIEPKGDVFRTGPASNQTSRWVTSNWSIRLIPVEIPLDSGGIQRLNQGDQYLS